MTIRFNTAAEAFVAIAWVICTADGFGSPEERDFLFQHIRRHDLFSHLSSVEFQRLLGATFLRVYPTYLHGGVSIADDTGAELMNAVEEVLAPGMHMEIWKMAVGLACADGLCDVEKTLLEQLRNALGLDDQATAIRLVRSLSAEQYGSPPSAANEPISIR